MTTIAPLPPAPLPSDDEGTLNDKMFATFGALPGFIEQTNAVAGEVNAAAAAAAASQGGAASSATAAAASQVAASASATAAATSAGAAAWVSGADYEAGDVRWSPADRRVYRRRTVGAGTMDPSADPTNWALVAPNGLQLVDVTGTSHTAASGGRYVFTNPAATTLTAPPTPQPGDEFAYKTGNNRVDNLISWSGAKHEGLSDATTILNGSRRGWGHFVYINDSIGWGAIG